MNLSFEKLTGSGLASCKPLKSLQTGTIIRLVFKVIRVKS